jgi:DNA repair protein SbcD/Mre11
VPLDTGDFQVAKSLVRTGARTIGALHCDLDQTSSSYAPVSRQRLDQAGLDAWLLGHVHMPGDLTGRNPVGYLGSLVGLDIGEPGPRGAWRVRADHQGVHCEQLALGPVRWERISIDLSTLETGDAQEFLTFIRSYLKERLANDPSLDPDMTHVVITRITLTGSPAHRECARQLAEEAKRELPLWPLAGFEVIVESIRDETRDRVDLVALANQPTPVGRVATTILDIQRDQATDLQERAQETIRRVADGGWETHEKDYPLPPANQALEDAAWRVLHHMLAQQETAS